jgi:hypothetical protein
MCNAIASQFIRHDLSGFTAMRVEQTSEKALSGFAQMARKPIPNQEKRAGRADFKRMN